MGYRLPTEEVGTTETPLCNRKENKKIPFITISHLFKLFQTNMIFKEGENKQHEKCKEKSVQRPSFQLDQPTSPFPRPPSTQTQCITQQGPSAAVPKTSPPPPWPWCIKPLLRSVQHSTRSFLTDALQNRGRTSCPSEQRRRMSECREVPFSTLRGAWTVGWVCGMTTTILAPPKTRHYVRCNVMPSRPPFNHIFPSFPFQRRRQL